jgi:hypothetical protein
LNEIVSDEEQIDTAGSLVTNTSADIDNSRYTEKDAILELPKEQLSNKRESYRYEEGECPRCEELEKALLEASPISSADYLSENKIKFIIPRERYKEIKSAMRRSTDSFLLIVDGTSRSLVSVEPDTLR